MPRQFKIIPKSCYTFEILPKEWQSNSTKRELCYFFNIFSLLTLVEHTKGIDIVYYLINSIKQSIKNF